LCWVDCRAEEQVVLIGAKLFRRLLLMAGLAGTCCLSCCLLPSIAFRLEYGRPPLAEEKYDTSLETVKPGMTFDEVRAVLGEPHEKYPSSRDDEGEVWLYWTDSIKLGYLGVQFSKEGRVLSQWI
jgi:hypothetical protein